MTTQVHNGTAFATVAMVIIGLLFLVGGGLLFNTHLGVAGYGIWIFVWGLAFLIGAMSRSSGSKR